MNLPSKILLTGAAGRVGQALRPLLRKQYAQVLLTDIKSIVDCQENETFQQGDITDFEFAKSLVESCDGIVHLAGIVGNHPTFAESIGPNYIGTHNILRAAVDSRIRNIVYASSHHTVGFMKRGEKIDHMTAPRPNSEYALSKAFGESAASYFADNFGLNILSIRIGYIGSDVSTERRLHTWISDRDLAQLVTIGLQTDDLGYQIVYGVSDCDEPFFDNRNAERLGYRPQDHSRDAATSRTVLDLKPDLNTIEEGLVGGGFAAVGFAGNKSRILKQH
jgi:uronate dehydrogenase